MRGARSVSCTIPDTCASCGIGDDTQDEGAVALAARAAAPVQAASDASGWSQPLAAASGAPQQQPSNAAGAAAPAPAGASGWQEAPAAASAATAVQPAAVPQAALPMQEEPGAAEPAAAATGGDAASEQPVAADAGLLDFAFPLAAGGMVPMLDEEDDYDAE